MSYKAWITEFEKANKRVRKWHKAGDRVVDRFVDKTSYAHEEKVQSRPVFSLNLFHSNVTTLISLLYGNLPQVDVSRKYADANDDVARVAAETMERLLNCDISDNSQDYDAVLRGTLQDRLLPGLGCARVRYEFETKQDPETGQSVVTKESAPIDYYHWRDVLWGWGRNFSELPWIAFRSYLTKDELIKRFGKNVAEDAEFKYQDVYTEEEQKDPETQSSKQKACVWEIWDKKKKKVHWLVKGYEKIAETKDDPLKLSGFYPCPPFFIANVTTSLYLPTPDFHLSQDLYNEIDILQSRIAIITEAVKVVGVYDKSAEGVERMFQEGVDNKLIPVDNWAMFAEKGGLQGQIDWFPIQDVVATLGNLRQLRDETITLLQQVTGMSDLMQGGLQNQYEGVGQSQIKARFGSVRIQKLQDEFASFASGLLQIKCEVISRHFEPKTIAMQSNMANSFDADKLPQAIQLIKNPEMAKLRITVRPESVAMTDFAQLQNERVGYMNALATFMQSAAPLVQQDPSATPFLLQLLQWGLSGFKGSSEIEGVIDKAIEQAQQNAQNPKPDPAQQAAQQQMQAEQMKIQGEMQKIQAKAQADMQLRAQDMQADIQTAQQEHQMKMAEIQAQAASKMAEIRAKMEADILVEQVQAQTNIAQAQAQVEGEMMKNEQEAVLDIAVESEKTMNKIDEIGADLESEIAKSTVKEKDDGTEGTD